VNEEAIVRVGPQRHKEEEEEEKKKITVVIRNTHFRSFVPTHRLSYKKLVTYYCSWYCFEGHRVITRRSMVVPKNRENFCSLLLKM
jgi:hypothetical protein